MTESTRGDHAEDPISAGCAGRGTEKIGAEGKDTDPGVSDRERLAELIESEDRRMAPEVFVDPALSAGTLADAILAAGWRPPQSSGWEPMVRCSKIAAPLRCRYAAGHFGGCDPVDEDLEGGVEREPSAATAWQWAWRLAGHPDAVPVPASEATARKQAELDPDTEVVRRRVGEWEVVHRG